jgi:hypothetical protein
MSILWGSTVILVDKVILLSLVLLYAVYSKRDAKGAGDYT